MKSHCFIYNPAANPAASFQQFKRLKRLTQDWENTRFLTSRKKGDIEQLAREAAEDFDVVVACGGDGTAREVAVGMMHSDAAMGVIPMGSGNDFSKTLNMPGSLRKSVEILRTGRRKKMDMARSNELYFINSFGIGFDGMANYHALHSKLKGNLKYLWGALKANASQKPMPVTITPDGGAPRTESLLMISLANGRVEGGGFILAPDARIDDGRLDIVTVRPVSKWILPFLLPLFTIGKQEVLGYVHIFRTAKLAIRLETPAFIHADGEILESEDTEFEIEVIPSVLNVIGDFRKER